MFNFIRKFLSSTATAVASWPIFIREPFTGAWQKNTTYERKESLLRNSAIYACVTGISSDIGKMRIKLCENNDGIWEEITKNQPWLPVLRKPNHYQTRIEFLEQWIISKLLHGNAYIIKERKDARGIVTAMYVLDPHRVTPLVTPDGEVFYRLGRDDLSRVTEDEARLTFPASEIIHDRMPALWHPLVGVPPIYACIYSGTLANRILNHSVNLVNNGAIPGGILTVPGELTKEKATELKESFEKNYSGENMGRTVVLTGGMGYQKIEMMTAQQAQLAVQLKLTVEDIARAFHYPLFKLGGPVPTLAGNVESLITTYYTDCLQTLIEKMEICLDEGLELPSGIGTELDLDNLMRMDTSALYESNNKAIDGGWMKPDEARFKANLKSVPGGDTPYMQQQNYSLAALAKRDAKENPFESKTPTPAPAAPAALAAPPPPPPKGLSPDEIEKLGKAYSEEELRAA